MKVSCNCNMTQYFTLLFAFFCSKRNMFLIECEVWLVLMWKQDKRQANSLISFCRESKFNRNTLGWKTVFFFIFAIVSWPLYRAIDPQCVYMSLYRIHWLSSNLSWFASLNNEAFGKTIKYLKAKIALYLIIF